MLRHPVVISSLAEDFRKIGLLSEGDRETTMGGKNLPDQAPGETGTGKDGHKPMKGNGKSWLSYKTGELRPQKQSADRKDPNIDYMDDDEDASDDEKLDEAANVAAFAEAVKFAEDFEHEFVESDAEEEISLTKMEMRDLESLGESVTLPFDVLAEDEDEDEDSVDERKMSDDDDAEDGDDEDDDDDDEDDEDDDEEVDEGKRRVAGGSRSMRTKKMSSGERSAAKKYYRAHKATITKQRVKRSKSAHGKRLKKIAAKFGESVAAHLDKIEAFVAEAGGFDATEADSAKKAFANIALIADALATEFAIAHESIEDSEFDTLSFNLDEMAAQAAAIAEHLAEGADPDTDTLSDAFKSMAENLLSALSVFAELDEDAESAEEAEEPKEEKKGGFPFKKGMTGKGKTPAGKESKEC